MLTVRRRAWKSKSGRDPTPESLPTDARKGHKIHKVTSSTGLWLGEVSRVYNSGLLALHVGTVRALTSTCRKASIFPKKIGTGKRQQGRKSHNPVGQTWNGARQSRSKNSQLENKKKSGHACGGDRRDRRDPFRKAPAKRHKSEPAVIGPPSIDSSTVRRSPPKSK